MDSTPTNIPPLAKILYAFGTVALAYWVFFYRSDKSGTTENEPSIPGWDDLVPCSDMVSLDGTKTLTLEKDHGVIFHDNRLKTSEESEPNAWAAQPRADVNTMGPLRVLESFSDHIARSKRRLVVTITSRMGSLADNNSGGQHQHGRQGQLGADAASRVRLGIIECGRSARSQPRQERAAKHESKAVISPKRSREPLKFQSMGRVSGGGACHHKHKKIELFDDKPECNHGDAGAHPRKKRPLIGRPTATAGFRLAARTCVTGALTRLPQRIAVRANVCIMRMGAPFRVKITIPRFCGHRT
jgi:hypothetical protein